jgi:hypothetical protein
LAIGKLLRRLTTLLSGTLLHHCICTERKRHELELWCEALFVPLQHAQRSVDAAKRPLRWRHRLNATPRYLHRKLKGVATTAMKW